MEVRMVTILKANRFITIYYLYYTINFSFFNDYVVFQWAECFPWQLLSILILCFLAVQPQVWYNSPTMKFNICWEGWSKVTDVFLKTKSNSHLTLATFDQMCFTKSNQQIKLTLYTHYVWKHKTGIKIIITLSKGYSHKFYNKCFNLTGYDFRKSFIRNIANPHWNY